MNKKLSLVAGLMISSSVLADQSVSPATNQTGGALSAPVSTNTEAAAAATTKTPVSQKSSAAGKKSASELKTVPLVPGPAVVSANHVNVRGQAKLNSEVITRMTNGEPVQVIEEIHLKRSGADEPSAWAKIVLPEKVHAWVHTSYIDPTSKTVRPRRLNIRGGPGENYSVLGTLQRGDAVKEIQTKGDWTEIEAPTNAYAFMAAQYLSQEPAAVPGIESNSPVTTITEASTVEAATNTPAGGEISAATNRVALLSTNGLPPLANAAPVIEAPAIVQEPPPPRIVQREGIVRGTFSVQAPTKFELISPDNGRAINYLYAPATDFDLSRYKGLHIIVTGEEGLDERWKNTPVITIQKIQVVE